MTYDIVLTSQLRAQTNISLAGQQDSKTSLRELVA